MDYRIALQELGIQQLKLSEATEPITAEKDPYKIMQVHDYKNISFLRQPPAVKAASTEVIKKFSLAYPELLKASHHPTQSSSTRTPFWTHLADKHDSSRRSSSSTSLQSWVGCMQ